LNESKKSLLVIQGDVTYLIIEGVLTMFRMIINLLAVVSLVLTLITAILDLTKSLADSTIVMSPLGKVWFDFHNSSLNSLQVGIQRKLNIPWAWDSIFVNILQMPAWFVFAILAAILFWLGRKSKTSWRKRFGA